MFRTLLITLISFILLSTAITAQDIPPRPQPPKLVNDLADILSPRQEKQLEEKLRQFNDTTSNQITIVTIQSLGDYDPSGFAYEIGEKWKVGQADFNNGIVVLVKPKYGENDKGRAYIAVGYGLEPAIPDITAKHIVDREMIPAFRSSNYFKGLNDATDVLMALAAGEISAKGYNKKTGSSSAASYVPILVIVLVIFLIRMSSRRSFGMGKRGSSLPFWAAMMLGNSIGRSHSGSWNDFSGGGSGFGGGGSGFSGFGGGSFGGGGAGGSW